MNRATLTLVVLIIIISFICDKILKTASDIQTNEVLTENQNVYITQDIIKRDDTRILVDTPSAKNIYPGQSIGINLLVSVESVLNFIRNHKTDLQNFYELLNITEITIDNYDYNDQTIYFATLVSDYFWAVNLYEIVVRDGQIVEIIPTAAGGNKELFSYDIVNISQGTFIASYNASHMGNGTFDLISVDDVNKITYSFSSDGSLLGNGYKLQVIDNYCEETTRTAIKHNLSDGYEDETVASSVYYGGKLEAYFVDINDDGHTDVVFKGIEQTYLSSPDYVYGLSELEYYCKYIFLYNQNTDKFEYNPELSQYLEILN